MEDNDRSNKRKSSQDKSNERGTAGGKTYTVGEFARMTGVTERTLRFYDRKGLLVPSSRNAQGHRIYTDGDLLQLQKIVTLKYLDFSLEDISVHLGEQARGLTETLDLQFELLKRKRDQLERVLSTMERMRAIVEGMGEVDNTLLLLFIHNIVNEDRQREALSRYWPESFVSAIFMENMTPEERLELERRMAAAFAELLAHYRAGRAASDAEVLDSGMKLLVLLREVIEPSAGLFGDDETGRLELLNDQAQALEQDPVISQIGLPDGAEQFLAQVFESLSALDILMIGGNDDGS